MKACFEGGEPHFVGGHGAMPGVSESLIHRIYGVYSNGLHFAMPASSLRTDEADLVRGVFQVLQGFSSSLFYWDHDGQRFHANTGIYVSHLSQRSLNSILNQFLYAATCLQLVKVVVDKVESSARSLPPTLRAFSCSVAQWLKRLRDIALTEEIKISNSDIGTTPTLLGLAGSLSSLCSGAEYLLRIVNGAVPEEYLDPDVFIPAFQIATHILNHLYGKLNDACLVQDGEEEAYRMVLYIFVGSLLPYIEVLDSWLFEGILNDPFQEMFFYANKTNLVDEADFWERSYLPRLTRFNKLNPETSAHISLEGKDWKDGEHFACPLFIQDIVMPIVSAGKSLQLIQHIPRMVSQVSGRGNMIDRPESFNNASDSSSLAGLTLSEAFCVSLAGLISDSEHIFSCFWGDDPRNSKISHQFESSVDLQDFGNKKCGNLPAFSCSKKIWYKFLVDALSHKGKLENLPDFNEKIIAPAGDFPSHRSFCPVNPVLTVCQEILNQNRDSWNSLNISRNFHLSPLNNGNVFAAKETNDCFGFKFCESLHPWDDIKALEKVFPFPTLLPSFQEGQHISELLPFQNNSTLPSRFLSWIQSFEPKSTPLPVILTQECLIFHIKKQVAYIGRDMLSKLIKDWRLMEELSVLRAVYLLGSGDLLQHFLTVIFNKLDKGESWDDDFELNTVLQESIRNSADGMLLGAPNSLVVSVTKRHDLNNNEQQNAPTFISTPKSRDRSFGIDGLHSLNFAYKVPWPLELITNMEAIKKYNQVMGFLLKVKRAKYVLDKARQWIWKGRSIATVNCKHHWLVEQKLLHFVDAFHQYVMDRVYHTAWRELCERMATARSLDEVIEVHEAYLLSIQRQCFVVPDKLWALIASRINSILGLALDLYSIQQVLGCGGVVPSVKARCEMEVDRIEKHFDDCIAFLLRVLSLKLNVGHFPHLADLVTRINYNHFYLSDAGNPVSTKPGKPFSIRKD